MCAQVSRVLSFALAVVVVIACPASAFAADPPAPVPLTLGWQYAPDPGDKGLAANWQSGRFGSTWEPTTVPHVFDARPLPNLFKGTVGWYRVAIKGPPTAEGTGWWLRFEQVRRKARVWLNGRELGSNTQPYTPFELPAIGLKQGQPNLLVVRADNRRVPGTREGWWNWGGITRPVSLISRGPVVLRDAGVMPARTCDGDNCTCTPSGGCHCEILTYSHCETLHPQPL